MGGICNSGSQRTVLKLTRSSVYETQDSNKNQEETPKKQQGSSRKINLLEATLAGRSRYLL